MSDFGVQMESLLLKALGGVVPPIPIYGYGGMGEIPPTLFSLPRVRYIMVSGSEGKNTPGPGSTGGPGRRSFINFVIFLQKSYLFNHIFFEYFSGKPAKHRFSPVPVPYSSLPLTGCSSRTLLRGRPTWSIYACGTKIFN